MIPVEQRYLKPPEGDCFAACMASILELPLDGMPNFKGSDWFYKWQEWLKPMNLTLLMINYNQEGQAPYGYSILGAQSPRGDFLHAVVCFDGEIVHDPHPQREQGVGERVDWTVFLVRDPSVVRAIGQTA
jgi:hypothetical protein